MLEIDRSSGDGGCFELEFVEREATAEPAVNLGIRLYLAEIQSLDTILTIEILGVQRCRSTVHN